MTTNNNYCPICDKCHDFILVERERTVSVKNENINCTQKFYVCCETGEEIEFESGKLLNENLALARNAYRKKHNLLTSDEIRKIREKYNFTQSELALVLDWGEVTITRYETKQIQDEAHDTLLRLIDSDPKVIFDRLKSHRNMFSEERYQHLKDILTKYISTDGVINTKRKVIKEMYVNYDCESDENGNKILDIDKTIDVISYFAIYMPDLYKVKLMKLLWYADMLSFKENGSSLTGLVYMHQPHGALPHGHAEILSLNEICVTEESNPPYENSKIHITSKKTLEELNLTGSEKNLLDRIIAKFKNYNGTKISEYMHKEQAYIRTSKNEIIPYHFAKDLNPF